MGTQCMEQAEKNQVTKSVSVENLTSPTRKSRSSDCLLLQSQSKKAHSESSDPICGSQVKKWSYTNGRTSLLITQKDYHRGVVFRSPFIVESQKSWALVTWQVNCIYFKQKLAFYYKMSEYHSSTLISYHWPLRPLHSFLWSLNYVYLPRLPSCRTKLVTQWPWFDTREPKLVINQCNWYTTISKQINNWISVAH